jgi:zinc transport system ATP-binding protein
MNVSAADSFHDDIDRKPLLRIERLGVRYGSHWALRDFDLDVHRGDMVGIIGPNGGGKSTLFKAILGLVAPTSGRVIKSSEALRIGYVPQHLTYDTSFPITVGEFLTVNHPGRFFWCGGVGRKQKREITDTLERLHVADLLGQRLGTLSGGQFQRILVAAALLQKPELLLLDEPSASVDRRGSDDLRDILKEIHHATSLSVLFVSHDLHFVSHLAKKVCCLNQTCCAEGAPETVLTGHLLAQTYGTAGKPWPGLQPAEPLPR